MNWTGQLAITICLLLCSGHAMGQRWKIENEIRLKESGHEFTDMLCGQADSETCGSQQDGSQHIKFVVKNHSKRKLSDFKHLNGICNGDGPIEKEVDLVESDLGDIPSDYACAVGFRRIDRDQSVKGFCGILTWHLDTSPPTRLVATYDTKELGYHHKEFLEEHSVRLWSDSSELDVDDLEEMYQESEKDRMSSKRVVEVVKSREGIKVQGRVLTEKNGNCLVTLEVSLFDDSDDDGPRPYFEEDIEEDLGQNLDEDLDSDQYQNFEEDEDADQDEDSDEYQNYVSDVDNSYSYVSGPSYQEEPSINQAGSGKLKMALGVVGLLFGVAVIIVIAWTCKRYMRKRQHGKMYYSRASTNGQSKKKKPYKPNPQDDEKSRRSLMDPAA